MKEQYFADKNRYDCGMEYERCGRSGVLLPKVSLGFWHNFGSVDPYERSREITHYAFDHGITHFDLANNYGPVYGSAEETMGRLMDEDFRPYRDELFISTKAGYDMWPGPYGNWGSRKYLMASLDQSLRRMKIDYVDLFYSHRYDPDTPLEETLQALVDIVRQGKALYVGISNWPLEALKYGHKYLKDHDVPLLIYQGRLNMLSRTPQETGITDFCAEKGIGFIAFSPLAQGLLTDRYLQGIPADSRMAKEKFLKSSMLTPERGPEPWRDPGRDGPRLDPPPARRHLRPRRCQLHRPAREEPQMRHRRPLRRSALTPQRLYFGVRPQVA